MILRISLVIIAAFMPTEVFAHAGTVGSASFLHGFAHPISGLDHVLAMVATGIFASYQGGRATWLVPVSFIAMMAVGSSLGSLGASLQLAESGIAVSVGILGLLIALDSRQPVLAAMAVVGFFALFHGYAHGAEMPQAASTLWFDLGFMSATALLQVMGICIVACSTLAFNTLVSSNVYKMEQVVGSTLVVASIVMKDGVLSELMDVLTYAGG